MRALSLMADAAHANGALAGVELWHGGLFAEQRESRLPPARAVADRERLGRRGRAQGDGGSPTSAACRTSGWPPPGGPARGVRHPLRVRLPHVPADPVPLAALQPPHRRLRRLVREPQPLLARGDRAGEGGDRRRLRDRHTDRRRHARAARASSPRRVSRSSARPSRWSTSGTSPSAPWRARGASMPAPRASSSRATSSSGRRASRRRRQADRRGRPVHRSRHDGRGDPRRPRRPDRGRAAVDLGSVPPAQDRGGPLRRDARVHRLQRLLLAVGLGPASRLHPEPDRGRGAPPRLASRALRPGGERRGGRARGRRRAGRAWSAPWCSPSAGSSSSTWPTPATTSAARCVGDAASRPRRVGARRRLPAGRARAAAGRRGRAGGGARRRRRARLRRADRGRRDRRALDGRRHERVTRAPIPGADASLPHVLLPEDVMVDGSPP